MKLINLPALIITILILYFSTTLPKTVINNKSELLEVRCGWPLHYMIQDQSWRDPSYPWQTSCGFYALEEPTHILWIPFFANVTIIYTATIVLLSLINSRLKTPPHPHP